MPILAEEQWLFSPPVPRDMESLDLSPALVTDLVLRRLSVEGTATIQSLSSFLKLPVTIVQDGG
jgi:hypothetical protein